MSDLKFEVTMLESELTLLKEELEEVTEAWSELEKENETLKQKLARFDGVSRLYKQATTELTKLRADLQKSEKSQIEITQLKRQIIKLEAEIQRFKDSPARREIAKYKQFFEQEEDERLKYQRRCYQYGAEVDKYKEQIRSLTERLSSPYMKQQRGMWKFYTISLAFSLTITWIAMIWLIFF
jgi:chromosome segregation ATPase